MNAVLKLLRKAWFPILCVSFVIAACNVNEGEEQQVFSFATLADSLKGYDSAVILLQDAFGNTLDTLFHGPVNANTNLKGLEAPHYAGGIVKIVIQGFKAGTVVYLIERNYDGKTGIAQPAVPVLLPSAVISLQDIVLKVKVGDTSTLPNIQLSPANLSTKQISWSSTNPAVIRVDQSGFRALMTGTAWLRAQLGSDVSKKDSIKVEVSAQDPIQTLLDSLRLSPETLHVAENGALKQFRVAFYPANGPSEIIYGSLDSTVATINPAGWVRGIKSALTRVFARSVNVPGVSDTAWVNVLPKVAVDSIRFKLRELELFQQGAAQSLIVQAYPLLASQEIEFQVRNAGIAKVTDGQVQGLLEGETWIIAKSVDNPSKLDSVRLRVLPVSQVDSVRVKPDTLALFMNGESRSLTPSIYPVTAQPRFIWSSGNPGVATVDESGKVTPGAQGHAYVSAISKADSSKRDSTLVLVKKDTPRLAVGPDSTISAGQTVKILPVAPQAFGLIVQFKADMNGDGTFEISSADLQEATHTYSAPGDYQLKFYVKDTEGNDTTVTRKIKAVDGLIVQIISPKDGFVTNQNPIDVNWSIDKAARTDKDTLKEGENLVLRSAKDAAGTLVSASIKVILDTKPPLKPIVRGPEATVNTRNPTWTWKGGGEGSGTFRALLDATNMAVAKILTDTFYTADSALPDGPHFLSVQERDVAGNWSASGQYTIRIDATPPAKPTVLTTPPVTNNMKPLWTWNKAVDGSGNFEYKIDNSDFSTPGSATSTAEFSPASNLAAGTHSLFVRERDSVGNWSPPGSAQVLIDTTPPSQPKLTGTSPTNLAPAWKWSTGGAGGSGTFRLRMGDGNFPVDAPETQDSLHVQNGAVSGTTYTLFVQERDVAGNWSKSTSLPIKYDLTSPTVAISAPQASGTYYTALAAIPMSGSATGPNAISKVSYAVDGGVSTNATVGAGGSWSIPSIPVADGKTILVTVTALDVLGNSGFSSLSVLRDNSAPNPPVIKTSPAAEVKTTIGAWTWEAGNDGSGSGLSGKYRYNLNNGAWTETTALTVANLTLTEGDNTFYLQEQDKVGNWSNSATNAVKLDTRGPTLAFTSPATTGNTHTSTTTHTHTIKGTASDLGVGVKNVECDLAGSPSVQFSNGNWEVTANFPAGTTTVNCWANDNLNTKGPTALIRVNINLPKPTISNLSVVAGMVLNTPSFTVNYNATVNGVTTSESKNVSLSEGENNIVFSTTATNAVGEAGALTVKYVLRSKAIFVNPTATGKSNGSSWADAFKNFEDAKSSSKAQLSEAQIWMSKGTYVPNTSSNYIALPSSLIILGGFDAATLPSDTNVAFRNRSTNRTIFDGFTFDLETIGSRFEFNMVEFERVRILNIEAVQNATLNFINCAIGGPQYAGDNWDIRTTSAMTLNMIGTIVQVKKDMEAWSLTYISNGGTFYAYKSDFISVENEFSVNFLQDESLSSTGGSFTFDDCTLNYEIGDFNPQVYINNPNTKVTVKNSRVRYGTSSISVAGEKVYQNNVSLP